MFVNKKIKIITRTLAYTNGLNANQLLKLK